jgi:uncharacterized protein with PIN domain
VFASGINERGFAMKEQEMLICQRCHEPLERISRNGVLERRILSAFGIYPWRCHDCHVTFYRRMRNHSEDGEPESDPPVTNQS